MGEIILFGRRKVKCKGCGKKIGVFNSFTIYQPYCENCYSFVRDKLENLYKRNPVYNYPSMLSSASWSVNPDYRENLEYKDGAFYVKVGKDKARLPDTFKIKEDEVKEEIKYKRELEF